MKLAQKRWAAPSGEDLPDRDLTDNEWCMQYVDLKKKVMLYTTKKKGDDHLEKDTPFMYRHIYDLTMKILIPSTFLSW